MTVKPCGCSTETCGCCEGTQKWTPMATANRPGLNSLLYRVGTHGTFFDTMKARLASMALDAPGADGQTIETFKPLVGLTTRDASDPAIALLDGWATVGDVLTFYQERIANEGYLRTATERRSILELARLVGYSLRPGVASTVYLAYTLEDKQLDPVEIPAGSRSQSIPGPDELPQSFETSENIIARTEWNNLRVRVSRPQNVTLQNALDVGSIFVAGINTNLKKGDELLLVFDDDGDLSVIRTVAKADGQLADNRTEIQLQPLPADIVAALPALQNFIVVGIGAKPGPNTAAALILIRAVTLFEAIRLGLLSPAVGWPQRILDAVEGSDPGDIGNAAMETAFIALQNVVKTTPPKPGPPPVTDPSQFVNALLKPPIRQARSSLNLSRSLISSADRRADVHPQLLINFAPQLQTTYYTAWESANVNASTAQLKAVYALRVAAPLFGASVPKIPTYFTETSQGHVAGQLKHPDQWDDFSPTDESRNGLFLDQPHEDILPSSYIVIQKKLFGEITRSVAVVTAAETAPRTAYGATSKTTKLTVANDWWSGNQDTMATLRGTLILGQSEPLTLIEEPITTDVSGTEIELGALYKELKSGRFVILSGERADIEAVTGVRVSELLMISGLKHDYDVTLPGDKTHTTLTLATRTAYVYKRSTLAIYANVVKATHGETRNETLGSGDGSKALQSFELKQPPLTFVPAPTAAGAESTLKVFVNDVEWHESDTLAAAGPKDRIFITKTDDDAKTTVIFGNGEEGSRLPTGVLNVQSVYRNGIGRPGNVLAEQISLLQTKPLGVKSVINPLRASGGADKENRDQARENAPLAVMALDRLVSVQDYTDFTRTFAGIGKADARRLSDGRTQLVHITIAGADDVPIDPVSDLYRNLLAALRRLGDASLSVRVESRELVALVASAKIRLAPDYQWDPVVTEVRARLLDEFGFQKRALGQPALLCEFISFIQNIEGVAYVDVDSFGGIPEKKNGEDGTRRLLTLDEMADAVKEIVSPGSTQTGITNIITPLTPSNSPPSDRVAANVAGFEGGILHPAQLVIFSVAVPDTLILNQIL